MTSGFVKVPVVPGEDLITSSRNPFALDMVCTLAEQGHEVYASDTFKAAAGSHSRYLAGHEVTASPRHAAAAFIADVERIVDQHGIEYFARRRGPRRARQPRR